jgi:hypothetical protein
VELLMITVAVSSSSSMTGAENTPALVLVSVAVTDSLPSTTESATGFTWIILVFSPDANATEADGAAL